MFDVCTTGDTAHIDTIFKFLPHKRQHGSFMLAQTPSFSKLFIPRTNGPVCKRVLCVLGAKCTLRSNHRLARVIFQHTKRLLPRSGHFLPTYTRIASRQKCELRWKTTYWGKNVCVCVCVCVYTPIRVQCRTPTAVFILRETAVGQKLMWNWTFLCHMKHCIAVNHKGILHYPTWDV